MKSPRGMGPISPRGMRPTSPSGMRPAVMTARRSQSALTMSYASASPRSPTSPRSSQYEDDDTVNSGGSGGHGGWLGMVKDTLFGDDDIYSEDGSEYSEVEEPSLGPYYHFGGAPATMEPKGTDTKNIQKPRSSNTWAPGPMISPPQSPAVRRAESVGFKLHSRQLTFPNRKTIPVREKKADSKKIDFKMHRNAEPRKTDEQQVRFPVSQITSPPISIKARADSQVEKAIIINKYTPPRPKPALRNTTPSPDGNHAVVVRSSTFGQQKPGQNHRLPLRSCRGPSRIPTNIFKRTPHSDITWDVTTASDDVSMNAAATESPSLQYLSPYFKHTSPSPPLQKKQPEPLKVKRSSTFNIGSSEKKQIYRPPGFPKERWSPLKTDDSKDAAGKSPPKPLKSKSKIPGKSKSKIPGPSSKQQQLEEENEIVFNDAGSDIENEQEDRLWDNHQLWDGLSYRMIETPSLSEQDYDRMVERWTPGDAKVIPTSHSDINDDTSVGKALEQQRKSLKSFYVSQLSAELACTEDPAIKTDPTATMTQASPLSFRVPSSPSTCEPIESPSTFVGATEKKVAFGWTTVKSPISRVSECTRETASTIDEKSSAVSSRSKVDKTPTNLLKDLLKDCGPRKGISRVSAAPERSEDFLRFDEDKLKAIIAEDDISKDNLPRVQSNGQSSSQAKTPPGGESNAPLSSRDRKPTFGSASRLRAKRAARKKEESEKDEEPYNMMATVIKYGVSSRNGTLKFPPVLKRSKRSEPSPTRPMVRVSLEMESAGQGTGVFDIARVSPAVGREMEPEHSITTEIGVESVLRTYEDKDGSPVGPDFLILDPLINLRGPEGNDGGKERRTILTPFKRFRNSPAERPRIDPAKLHTDSSSTTELVAAQARKQTYVNPFPRILESPIPTTRKGEAAHELTKTDSSAGRRSPPMRSVEVEDASSFQNEGIEVNRVSTPRSEFKAPVPKPTPLGAFRRIKKIGLNPAFLPRPQRKPLAVETITQTIRKDQEEFSYQGFEVEPFSARTIESIGFANAQTPAGSVRDVQKQTSTQVEEPRKSPTRTPSPETNIDATAEDVKESDGPPLNAELNAVTQTEAHGNPTRMESPVNRRMIKREALLAKIVAEATENHHDPETNDLKCAPPLQDIPRQDENENPLMAKQMVSEVLSMEDTHFSPQASIVEDGCFESQCKFEPQRDLEKSLAPMDFKPWHMRLLQDSSMKVPRLEATATAEDIIEDLDATSSIRKSRPSASADKDVKTLPRAPSKDMAKDANDEAEKTTNAIEKDACCKENQNSKHEEATEQERTTPMISEGMETVATYGRKMPNRFLDLRSTETTEPKLTMKKKLKNLFKRKKKTTTDLHPIDSSYHHLLAQSTAESTPESKSLRTKIISAAAVATAASIQRKDIKDTSLAVTRSKSSKCSSWKGDSKNQDQGIKKKMQSDMKESGESRSVTSRRQVEKKPEISTQTEVLQSPAECKESKKNAANHRNKIPKRLPLNKKYSSQSCASSVDNSLDKLMADDDELQDTISTDLSSSTNPSYKRVKLGDDGSTDRSKESSRLDKAENKVAKRLARDLRLLTRIERRRRELNRKPQAESYAESIEVLDTLEKLVKRRSMIAPEEQEGGNVLDHKIPPATHNDAWFGNLSSFKVTDMFACAAPPCQS